MSHEFQDFTEDLRFSLRRGRGKAEVEAMRGQPARLPTRQGRSSCLLEFALESAACTGPVFRRTEGLAVAAENMFNESVAPHC